VKGWCLDRLTKEPYYILFIVSLLKTQQLNIIDL
jgi:hypothetical protein